MSELTQSLRWQEEQRNLEWRRACRFDEHRRYSQEEKDLHRRIWRQRLRHPSKLSPELAKMDAENYIAKHGKIINQQSYVEAINNYYKKDVEKLTDSGYNISEISDYAYKAYIMQEYAEVVTEYRVKKLLGGT